MHIHYWWAIKRQVACLFRPRPDGPPGCPMVPTTRPLLKMIWNIHHQARPQLLELSDRQGDTTRLFHIRSPRELREFALLYCTAAA